MSRVRLVGLLLAVALVAASCGDPAGGDVAAPDTPPPIETTIGSDATVPGTAPPVDITLGDGAVVTRACGPVEFGSEPVDTDQFEPFTGDVSAFIGEEARLEYEASLDWWQSMEWSVVDSTEQRLALFGQIGDLDDAQFGFAEFQTGDDGWRATGWGGCHIVAEAEGFGVATFVLDRDNPPDPASRTLAVLATERACASGQAPVDRQVLPVVVESATSVEITLLVESPRGGQSCPSNPPFPYIVELVAPLGQRLIRDLAIHPGEDRPWPPPSSAAVLELHTAGNAPADGTANVVAWSGKFAGALLFGPDDWSSEPTWFQSFIETLPGVISGFVTECDGCEEECEGEACDALPRLGPECSATVTPVPGEAIIMTIRFVGLTCTIEDFTQPID